jgi:hypothetical protein
MKLSIDRLEAGRELDALVAQNVMGWKNVHREDIGRGGKRDQYRGTKPDKLGRWRSADVRHYSTYSASNERARALGEICERTLKDDSGQGPAVRLGDTGSVLPRGVEGREESPLGVEVGFADQG